jgi:hypothetical protein
VGDSTNNGVSFPKLQALTQAVIWANGQAHAVRHDADQVVSTAKKFAAFLDPPEADTPA